MRRLTALGAILMVLVACSNGEAEQTVTDIADSYARGLSGGETLGCTEAEPGPEAEAHSGCIYTAAFAGCLEGLTGEQVGPRPAEEEWSTEPALVALHERAVSECEGETEPAPGEPTPEYDPYERYLELAPADAPELSRDDAQARAFLGCDQNFAPETVDAALAEAYRDFLDC